MEDKVKIAVLEEQFKGLREQHKSLSESLEKKVDDNATATRSTLKKLSQSVEGLIKSQNEKRGYTRGVWASIAASGTLGGIIAKILGAAQ